MYELQIIIIVIVAIVVGGAAMYFLPKLFSSSSKDPVKCPDDCSNNGMCLPNGTCKCDKGYVGYNCSKEGTPATCPNNCSNHGACNDGTCLCNQGFSGSDCSTNSCPAGYAGPGCQNCDKEGGYTFDPNDTTKCIVNRCSDQCKSPGGFCENASTGTCKCNTDYFGPTCQILCKNGADYDKNLKKCVCTAGYGGSDCSVKCPMGNFKVGEIQLPESSCNTTLGGGQCDTATGKCTCVNNAAFSSDSGCGFSNITQLAVNLLYDSVKGMITGQCPAVQNDAGKAVGEFMRRWSAAGFDKNKAAQMFTDACNCKPNEVDYDPALNKCRQAA